ncbi:hypothetical protein [Alteromonas halophila]|uniref:hypothetical protein n=1 Tax=Alteromonas halophila TaxID=516698 RepID=UPI001676F0B3|nr:hypothetical protein [Alteromonas halophila]
MSPVPSLPRPFEKSPDSVSPRIHRFHSYHPTWFYWYYYRSDYVVTFIGPPER